jgi:hypothetical protein
MFTVLFDSKEAIFLQPVVLAFDTRRSFNYNPYSSRSAICLKIIVVFAGR